MLILAQQIQSNLYKSIEKSLMTHRYFIYATLLNFC